MILKSLCLFFTQSKCSSFNCGFCDVFVCEHLLRRCFTNRARLSSLAVVRVASVTQTAGKNMKVGKASIAHIRMHTNDGHLDI